MFRAKNKKKCVPLQTPELFYKRGYKSHRPVILTGCLQLDGVVFKGLSTLAWLKINKKGLCQNVKYIKPLMLRKLNEIVLCFRSETKALVIFSHIVHPVPA